MSSLFNFLRSGLALGLEAALRALWTLELELDADLGITPWTEGTLNDKILKCCCEVVFFTCVASVSPPRLQAACRPHSCSLVCLAQLQRLLQPCSAT